MKFISFLVIFIGIVSTLNAQDTLFLKMNKMIVCQITEIGIDEIKYKAFDNLEGPMYVIRKNDVLKIVFKNGKEEFILPDEMDMNKEEAILDKNQVIKFAFLSPLFDHVQFIYERKIKMTQNLETRVGLIGFGNENMYDDERQGIYIAGGVKFLLGTDYYIKGMRYLHPLKGSYLKPEITISVYDFNKEVRYYYGWNYPATTEIVQYRASLAALNIIYGKQYILGNVLTFDFHVGVGVGVASLYKKNHVSDNYKPFPSNYGNLIIVSDRFPMTLTSGISIGYIFK